MKGRLKLAGNKKTWLLVREDGKEMQIPARVLTRTLLHLNPQKHDGLEVEYELDKGLPSKIYEVGAEWQPHSAPQSVPVQRGPRPQSGGSRGGGTGRSQFPNRGESRPDVRASKPSLPGDFHNPYNFVPAPPRKTQDSQLGDYAPAGHDRYRDKLWSGRIAVKLTTHSPLLIFDAGRAKPYSNDNEPGHKIFPTRLGTDGKPYLPPTSIKGMLRSAYEAVTNSRFAVFEKHQDRLAYRMAAKIGPVPARVEKHDGKDVLRVMQAEVIGFAAKLPRYEERSDQKDKGARSRKMALPYPDGKLPEHGDAVWVQVNNSRVSRIERRTDENPPAGNWTKGWACVTGPNISKKRYERVFLEEENDRFIPITDKHLNLWRELIQNYRETHELDLKKRENAKDGPIPPQDYLGDKPGKTGWSRHIYEEGERELREGILCYVEFVANSDNEIAALIPVTISRRLYSASPDDLLPESLKPAQSLEELSPAERVFGWVNQNGPGAYRGSLRIGPVRCTSPDPLVTFLGAGLPLTILGQPKPQQARFYVAQSKQGEAQPNGTFKEQAGYLLNKGLRGRKVYPHHAGLPEGYWDNPLEDRTQRSQNGFFQEYRRPHEPVLERGAAKLNSEKTGFELKTGDDNEQRDDQNRSITSWVKPQTVFEFDIDVTNLSSVELGALLWLLELPAGHFHRLGGAKPLGFGSVGLAVDWEVSDLRRGADWRVFYNTLDEGENPDRIAARECVREFEEAVAAAYGNGDLNRVSFIAAFKLCAKGFEDGKPIHYPRALQQGQARNSTIPPHPEGKAFEWFVANERTGRESGPKLALSDLTNDEGLPILETK